MLKTMGKGGLLMRRRLGLVIAALVIGLHLLFLAAPVHATPASTFAELNFRRFNDEPFADPGYYIAESGTSLTSLSYTSPRGSIGRFTADAAAGTLRGFADAVNGKLVFVVGIQFGLAGMFSTSSLFMGQPPAHP
jgi:hypothetical protein